MEPLPIFQVPASGADLVPATVVGTVAVLIENFGGALPSMKWKYTNGPPTTTRSATTTTPMIHFFMRRVLGVGRRIDASVRTLTVREL